MWAGCSPAPRLSGADRPYECCELSPLPARAERQKLGAAAQAVGRVRVVRVLKVQTHRAGHAEFGALVVGGKCGQQGRAKSGGALPMLTSGYGLSPGNTAWLSNWRVCAMVRPEAPLTKVRPQ